MSHSDGDIPEEHLQCTGTQSEYRETSDSSGTSRTITSSQSEIFSGYNNIYNNSSDCETYTSSQSEITTEYDASSEPNSREASRPSSPESGNLSVRTVFTHPRDGCDLQDHARCHPHSQRPTRESSDKELTKPTESPSSEQAPMQYSDQEKFNT